MSKMLSSWKEIAHFFGKGVRTVQRWEKTLDLPIRRPPGAPSNVVLARTSDLEEWMHRSSALRLPEGPPSAQSDSRPDSLQAAIAELDTEVDKLIEMQFGRHPVVSSHEASKGDTVTMIRSMTEKVRHLCQHDEHESTGLKKVA